MKKGEGLVQFIKFGVVGVSNTGVDWIIFYILTATILVNAEPFAKAIAFIAAVLNSYLWNSVWTFKKEFKKSIGSEKLKNGTELFVKFVVVSLIGWAINYYAFKYTRFSLDQGKLIALIAASGAATFWNFFGNKLWTYRKTA
ncbi:MAG: GtrA family protein [Patescibacteria group bacterium]|nr:GtrA family protein [Patescibacteria group bacterium]